MGVLTIGRRLRAALVLAIGLAAMLVANAGSSLRSAPLFDGVFTEEPYQYVDPPAGGARDPTSISEGYPVTNGAVALIALATTEVPPQAQVIAQADAFAVSADSTSLMVSIQPEHAPDADVQGNLYRFTATDQSGAALQIRSGTVVTIVLRAPQANASAQIARRDGTAWTRLTTENGGLPDLFSANVDQLGEFAVLLPAGSGPSPAPSGGGGGIAGGTPIWLVVAFVIAAGVVGLLWGRLSDRADRAPPSRKSKAGSRRSRSSSARRRSR